MTWSDVARLATSSTSKAAASSLIRTHSSTVLEEPWLSGRGYRKVFCLPSGYLLVAQLKADAAQLLDHAGRIKNCRQQSLREVQTCYVALACGNTFNTISWLERYHSPPPVAEFGCSHRSKGLHDLVRYPCVSLSTVRRCQVKARVQFALLPLECIYRCCDVLCGRRGGVRAAGSVSAPGNTIPRPASYMIERKRDCQPWQCERFLSNAAYPL